MPQLELITGTPRSSHIQGEVGRAGGPGNDGGHLVMNAAGGGRDRINIVAMLEELNRSGSSEYGAVPNSYYKFESMLRKMVRFLWQSAACEHGVRDIHGVREFQPESHTYCIFRTQCSEGTWSARSRLRRRIAGSQELRSFSAHRAGRPAPQPYEDPGRQHAEPVYRFAMTVRTRDFEAGDTEAVIALWEASGLARPWNDPRADISRCLETETSFLLIAEAEAAPGSRTVVGTVMAGYEGHRGWMNYLASDPEFRREGIGRALVAEAEHRFEVAGCPKAMLMVRGGNEAAIGFYEKLGYTTEDVLVLGKRLIED